MAGREGRVVLVLVLVRKEKENVQQGSRDLIIRPTQLHVVLGRIKSDGGY
jgi:hypothetical protein